MPGKLKAKIMAGRHLPVMDRASDLTDAFVEVKFGNTTFKTDVYPKSLNPLWNSEWFKFEVDDEDLQDEPLQITVLDHDTYSANDAIGKVYIDIDPLLCSEAATVISGWFPIYDTIHGIRGEINVLVKVDLFNDLNRFRQSSCGVKFFCTTSIPRCYRAVMVHGFVEELVVNEDPEYQWIDRIRTPRASNEARQRLISLMSGELQRKIGVKVLEMGGNAVIGYLQCFDLEGESGLVVRAIGTACTLEKISSTQGPPSGATNPSNSSPSKELKEAGFGEEAPGVPLCSGPPTPLRVQTFSSFSPSKSYSRQSSSSDTELSLTPKTARICLSPSSPILQSKSSPIPTTKALWSTTPPPLHVSQSDTAMLRKSVSFSEDLLLAASGMGSGGSAGKEAGPLKALLRQQTQSALEQREFPFFTLTGFPPGFLLHVGGVVSARSVKLLDRIHNPDEPETRDAWWEEIRQEIKSHAKALGCHAVVGYSESTSICEEVCILSASGTAAILSSRFMQDGALDTEHRLSRQHGTERGEGEMGSSASLGFDDAVPPACGFCHIPYDELNMPFPAQLTYCHCCRRHKVPDVLFTTIDVPSEAHVTGKGCLIQAREGVGYYDISLDYYDILLGYYDIPLGYYDIPLGYYDIPLGFYDIPLGYYYIPLGYYYTPLGYYDILLGYYDILLGYYDIPLGYYYTPLGYYDILLAYYDILLGYYDIPLGYYDIPLGYYYTPLGYYDILLGYYDILLGYYDIPLGYYYTPLGYYDILLAYYDILLGYYDIPLGYYYISLGYYDIPLGFYDIPLGYYYIPLGYYYTPLGYYDILLGYYDIPLGYYDIPLGYYYTPLGYYDILLGYYDIPLGYYYTPLGYYDILLGYYDIPLGYYYTPLGYYDILLGYYDIPLGYYYTPLGYYDIPLGYYYTPLGYYDILLGYYDIPLGYYYTPLGYYDILLGYYDIPLGYYYTPLGYYDIPLGYYYTPLGYYDILLGYYDIPLGYYDIPLGYYYTPLGYYDILLGYYNTPLGYYDILLDYYDIPLGYYYISLGFYDIPLGYYYTPLGYYDIPLGYHYIPLGYHYIPFGYHNTPLGHYETLLGHYYTPLGYYDIPLVKVIIGYMSMRLFLAKPCTSVSVLRLCRTKKKAQGEGNATAISNLLPFLEYELHTQLMNKLKLRSMNALFGLRIQISVGENMLLGLASATGVYLTALPSPGGIQIAGKTPSDLTYEQHLSNMQKKINDTIAKNKELYDINPPEFVEELIGSPIPEPRQRSRLFRSHSESSDEVSELDLSHGKKDAFVLEIDDTDTFEDIHSLLTDAPTPPGFYSCNTEIMPGIYNWTSELQMFTSVRVLRLSNVNLTNQGLNKIFNDLCENLLKSLYFKLRSMVPCCLSHVNFTVAVPEDELIQVAVTAVAMSFDKDQTQENGRQSGEKTLIKENEEQLQFPLELPAESSSSSSSNPLNSAKGLTEVSGGPTSARAPSVDYSSFTDRCSSWIEQLRLKAHTIRRGSIKTMSSLEKSSPLPEGRSRSLRSSRSYPGGSVSVVKMTPLSFIPGTKIIKYLGIINMFFIRETTSLREEGGVSGFLHSFIAEVFAMVRAHVAALGGNAVVSYSMKECVFMENPNKNQAQCLINSPLWERPQFAEKMGETRLAAHMFLWSLSAIYMFAFASFYVQIPGLYGNEGILPARWMMRLVGKSVWERLRDTPTLSVVRPAARPRHAALHGAAESERNASQPGGHDGPRLQRLQALSHPVGFLPVSVPEAAAEFWTLVGQVFLYFQWDNLLLEVGFLAVLIAPMKMPWGYRVSFHDSVTFWLLRWLLFRLMFTSGVVKLTSRCPTWWGLTALTYHYETQCIPTPLAWFAHQLPVWFQKLSVVATFVVEIAVPFLFFSPIRRHRLFSFYLQVLLQVLIIISGNYNFFNMLTIVLCFSLLDDEHVSFWLCRRRQQMERNSVQAVLSWVCVLVEVGIYALLGYWTVLYFDLKVDWDKKSVSSKMAFTHYEFNSFLKAVTVPSIWIGVLSLTWEVITAMFRSACVRGVFRRLWSTMQWGVFSAAAASMFAISLVPYTYIEYEAHSNLWPGVRGAFDLTDRYQLVNSYGLFRRMTGVGGRPEVIMEGSMDGSSWTEIDFMYKPGNMSTAPPVVVPHQPRLDWQMWFAALGPHTQSPWFSSLVRRLLQGKRDVIKLIQTDETRYPFVKQPPVYIRAHRYKYWFTEPKEDGSLPQRWWRRIYVEEFYPPVRLGDALLEDTLTQHGLNIKDKSPTRRAPGSWLLRTLQCVGEHVRDVPAHVLLWTLFSSAATVCLINCLVSHTRSLTHTHSREQQEEEKKDVKKETEEEVKKEAEEEVNDAEEEESVEEEECEEEEVMKRSDESEGEENTESESVRKRN
ncbi:hypothetical protein QTP70_021685 [Hemibagrus guttatus]|uniref:Lipase maturation factor n=1 Tax=Hemibagrus guttatus TaxID=175788 RepID=A0AAE0RBT8_9TELE|nr:hypothetical protein QTP70_021685 [Hemibagrus guttatus]